MEPVSLPEVLLDCQNLSEAQARKLGITVIYPQFSHPCFVHCDRMRLKQTLANLLSNAIKYNKAGGTVEVYCFARTPSRLRICVQDTGQGLPPEQLAQLFQPFNRLGQQDDGVEGTGIGLVVCKRLVELMGGLIGVESTVGKGSVFWIEVATTLAPTLDLASAEFVTPLPALDLGAVPTSTLLCVEDNPANLMLVEQIMVRRPDIRMISASNGLRGVEVARAVRPDIILMDINLPGLNGFDALRRLAEDPATADIPVVAVSANAIPQDVAKGLAAGFFRYITKPIKVVEFLDTVDLALAFAKAKSSGTHKADPA
jgi:CheY-like chemotaxis protein